MNLDLIHTIGIKQNKRKDSILYFLREIEGLRQLLANDFEYWSDFDSWKNISVQRWFFERALEVYKGKKIDLKCDCCKYIYVLKGDLKNILNEKCYGLKTAYMIQKIVDEIISAKVIRENDGTYSA